MKHIYKNLLLSTLILLALTTTPVSAQTIQTEKIKAPAWAIEEWVVGPPTSLEKLRGKVVVIDFFQL